jgi:hypothetical protein
VLAYHVGRNRGVGCGCCHRVDAMNWDISTPEGMANAMAWQAAHVARVVEGGCWVVPRSFSIYQLSRANKTATKLCGLPEPDIAKVFEAMGWTVIDKEEQP